jgi:predicted ferric reductase
MFNLDSLTSVAKSNILDNVSLHFIPPISSLEITVHLIPSWMNGIRRLICFMKYLSFNSLMLGTQTLSLYDNTPSKKLGDFSSLILRLISWIFLSSTWPFRISWSRFEPTSNYVASVLVTILRFSLSNSSHNSKGILSTTSGLTWNLRLKASAITLAFPGW